MSVRIYRPSLVWQPGDERVRAAVEATLERWRDTPYESGQSLRGLGADCIGSVFGVVDEMDGRERRTPPGMPQDSAMHDPARARAALRELVRRYSPCFKVDAVDGVFHVEPGDIAVTGELGGGPGHVEIVGGRKNELWHALPGPGFHQGGFGFFRTQRLFAIYRIADKERWS